MTSILLLSACATNSEQESERKRLLLKSSELEQREIALAERESVIGSANVEIERSPLLPPNAKVGECYARVWVEPLYISKSEQILAKPISYQLDVIPAEYEMVEESVLVLEASSRLVPVAAVYDWKVQDILVAEAKRSWHIEPYFSSPLATASVLNTASQHGIDLDSAQSGMCFHEHYHPAQFSTAEEQVLLSEASEEITTIDPEYRMMSKSVLVKEASTRLVEVPAQYEEVSEQVLDKQAHQIWKKGIGPVQKIDDATGEIMCLVDVPATYKTLTKRVLISPVTTKTIEIPAEYKTIQIQELVNEPSAQVTSIPAKYGTVSKEVMVKKGEYIWHEIHDKTDSKRTRTGNKICLVEKTAKYKTVKTKIVITPATEQRIDIPEKYQTVKVQKLVSKAKEVKTEIPAEYKTVTHQELEKEGYMEWRSIPCETNMSQDRIRQIQIALLNKGYNPGKIDGVVGSETIAAVNAFQRDNQLPVDSYLNIETIESLNVSTH